MAYCLIIGHDIASAGDSVVDEPVLALAILSLGTFVGVLVTTIVYVSSVRPRLLEAGDSGLLAAVDTQRRAVQRLQRELDVHSQQWAEYLQAIQQYQDAQRDVTDELRALRTEHAEAPAGMPTAELQALLSDHRTLLDTLQSLATTNNRTLKAQRRAVARQLEISRVALRRITLLMQTQAPAQSESVSELMAQLDELAALVQSMTHRPPARTQQDRLTDVRGIGPVFSGIMHEAGIHTFDQLAVLTPDEINTLLNLPAWRQVDTQNWIEQARHLSTQRRKLERYS